VLVSLSTKAYLDTPYAEPEAGERLGMPFYPKQTVAEFYDWDPALVHPRLPESSIAGVEAALWCESVKTFADAMFLVLPRFCGIAERGWSPAGGTWETYRPRLAAQVPLWDRQGWAYFRSPLIES
jgi:hexosaminidase